MVDDDAVVAAAVRRGLEHEGFVVDIAVDGAEALWMVAEAPPDLIILDIMLPLKNGFQVCAELRAADNWTPILMLTAKDGDLDEAEALDTGADDYIVKPFSFDVLLAHVRALLRRATNEPPPAMSAGDLRVDQAQRRAFRADVEIALTGRQFEVLEFLMRHCGQVVSKADILNGVWRQDFDGDPNIVEVYIRRLRKAIDEPFGRESIETVRGAGYRLSDS